MKYPPKPVLLGLVGQTHGDDSGQESGSAAQVQVHEEAPHAAPTQSHGLKQYSLGEQDADPQGTEPADEVVVGDPPVPAPEEQAETSVAAASVVVAAAKRA